MSTLSEVIWVVGNTLQIGNRVHDMTSETPLLGSIPEFDSMAVVSVITALEDHFDVLIDDDEIDADVFETIGELTKFVDMKLSEE